MNLMQMRGVNAFTCTEAKVSIDHELTHERSTTKGKKNTSMNSIQFVYYLLLECFLN